jgi:sulfur relay (sulfurtransferase) complex TusBCD TusD component (DsrE family)
MAQKPLAIFIQDEGTTLTTLVNNCQQQTIPLHQCKDCAAVITSFGREKVKKLEIFVCLMVT